MAEVADVREVADDDASVLAHIRWGGAHDRGLAFVTFTANVPKGPPVAPTLVAVRAFLAERWRLDLPPLEAATQTRRNAGSG